MGFLQKVLLIYLQLRATKMVLNYSKLSYFDTLKYFNISTYKYRIYRGDIWRNNSKLVTHYNWMLRDTSLLFIQRLLIQSAVICR